MVASVEVAQVESLANLGGGSGSSVVLLVLSCSVTELGFS